MPEVSMMFLAVAALIALILVLLALKRRKASSQPISDSKRAAPAKDARKAAPSAAPAAPQKTMMMEMPSESAPAGSTVAMQWYGLLLCTAGPLEGQRFIIEEDGFYIGRDAALSKVVIDDARISKRHVRVFPRNGKAVAIDQESTNGTFLNALGSPRITEVVLKRGDTLILADEVASFKYQI